VFGMLGWNKTVQAVERQIEAMASEVFEVGLFKPDATEGEAVMVPRVWDRDALARSIPWLRHQNRDGRNIYVRPNGEHHLSLIDDLTRAAIGQMKLAGFSPAVVVETSPGNFQAWLKHPERLDKEMGTAAARALAQRFGGDIGAADWRHFGRLSGFTNRKQQYRDATTGLHPFVKLVEAAGAVYPEAGRFLKEVGQGIENRHREEQERRAVRPSVYSPRIPAIKSIDVFRADPRYGGDGTRIDLAYAVYAISHGRTEGEVEAAIRSRDLSHKGSERRQHDYVERTIKKALAATERCR
jgi:RepB DNA-primase from phage plasmid